MFRITNGAQASKLASIFLGFDTLKQLNLSFNSAILHFNKQLPVTD
jgi:hypothetical protein